MAYERHLKLTLTFSATKALFDKYSEIGANHIIRSQLPNYANISSEAITCSSMGQELPVYKLVGVFAATKLTLWCCATLTLLCRAALTLLCRATLTLLCRATLTLL